MPTKSDRCPTCGSEEADLDRGLTDTDRALQFLAEYDDANGSEGHGDQVWSWEDASKPSLFDEVLHNIQNAPRCTCGDLSMGAVALHAAFHGIDKPPPRKLNSSCPVHGNNTLQPA